MSKLEMGLVATFYVTIILVTLAWSFIWSTVWFFKTYKYRKKMKRRKHLRIIK